MKISTVIKTRSGNYPVTYQDNDADEDLSKIDMHHIAVYAFFNGKIVLVHDRFKNSWTPPGGHIEEGESPKDAAVREVKEETNMKVTHYRIIGHQAITEPHRTTNQARAFCIVEPYGPFVADADAEGDIDQINLVDPKDTKQYFDWGEIGDYVLCRAIKMNAEYQSQKRT